MDTLPSTHTRKGPARVHIYGAGIAGLTAAHELGRRGFRVRVYEPAQEYDETGQPEPGAAKQATLHPRLAVGGMARSQYLRVAKGALGNFQDAGQFTASDAYRMVYDYSRDWDDAGLNPMSVERFLSRSELRPSERFPGIVHIRIPPPLDSERTPTRLATAQVLREFLTQTGSTTPSSLRIPRERVILVADEEEAFARKMEAPFPPLEDKDELLLELVHYLPGEHGFRFFPSYYRHLFSTMVETPILDDEGRPTGRRVFDNLVPSSFYGIAAQGRRIRFLRRAPSTRPVDMLQEAKELGSSGYPPKDMLQFTLRIWRYMCTCSGRRKADFEKVSWWEYLEGYEPGTGARRYKYSDAFKHDMQFAPRVLAAFDGAWGDARTNGNTFVQLYLNNVLPLPKTDGTLNGPTTPALFRPWRRYLAEHLGVEFLQGSLERLELVEGRLVPHIRVFEEPRGRWEERQDTTVSTVLSDVEEPVDYYVVATDAVTAEQVTKDLPPLGVVEGLRGFTSQVPPNPRGSEPAQPRTPGVLPGHVPWDRFQTLTGIQFFFPSSVRLAEGYLYFLDAPWGLSAINSQQYWAMPPTLAQDGFAAVLSVDIGNWYVREPGLKSPSACSRHEIAHEVWRQVKQATELHQAPLPQALQFGFTLPEPAWYYMDRYIRFETDEATGKERPVDNRAPYLIPIMGDWKRRPGAEPWDPMVQSPESKPGAALPEGLWQAPHGGYQVHWNQLLFAGTYLKTFTRMTTMEAANESARHAVNAIIDHYLAHHPQEEPRRRGVAGTREAPSVSVDEYSGQGTLTGSPEFRMTPLGEYCRIWDPEKHELPELASLRELDAKLFAAGLPHLWDLLHLEPLALPLLSAPAAQEGGAEALKSFLGRVHASLGAMRGSPLWPGL
jgi:hypothetical protein